MTVFEFQARVIERAATALAFWAKSTAADKLNWKPAIEGSVPTRSALEQIQECIQINRMFTVQLRGEAISSSGEEAAHSDPTAEEMVAQLMTSAKELAAAVRNMNEEALTREYTLPFAKMQGAVLLDLAAGNMMYHGGQINLIQMLCGDEKFHVPPGFTTF